MTMGIGRFAERIAEIPLAKIKAALEAASLADLGSGYLMHAAIAWELVKRLEARAKGDIVRATELCDEGNYFRADGSCVCHLCGKEYREHVRMEHLAPTFALLCDGRLVKL